MSISRAAALAMCGTFVYLFVATIMPTIAIWSSSESTALPHVRMDQYMPHIFRAFLYASWFPGRISSAYRTKRQGASTVGRFDAKVLETKSEKHLLLAHDYQNIANGCWTSSSTDLLPDAGRVIVWWSAP